MNSDPWSYVICIGLGRGSSPNLRLKLRDNYFCTYQFLPRKSTRKRQTSLNPNVEKSLTPWRQSRPRAWMLSLLEGFPPPHWISLQLLQPIHRNPRWGHSCALIFGLGPHSAHTHEIMMRTGPSLASAHNWSFSAPIIHVILRQRTYSLCPTARLQRQRKSNPSFHPPPQRPSIPRNFVGSTYPSPLLRRKGPADEYYHDFSRALKFGQKQVYHQIPT